MTVTLPASDNGATVVRASRTRFVKTRVDGGSLVDEIACTRTARVVAPRVLVGTNATTLVTARIKGSAPKRLDDDTLRTIARALVSLHAVRLPKKPRALPGGASLTATLGEAEGALAWLRANRTVDANLAARCRAVLRRARVRVDDVTSLEVTPERALCHGDVRVPNVLLHKGAARFVDFGLAGRGDPAVDVARFLAYERLNAHQRFVVLDAYAEERGDATVDRALAIVDVMPLCLALSALRYAVMASTGALATRDPRAHQRRIPALRARVRELARPPPRARPTRAGGAPSIPRVPHLSGSTPGLDDLVLTAEDEARARRSPAMVTEKLDGVAVAFFLDALGDVDVHLKTDWKRALDGRILRAARRWARVHADALRALLRDERVMLGEWLLHRLVVRYTALPSAVVMHGLVVDGALMPRVRSTREIARAGFATMPPLFAGVVGARAWASFVPLRARFGDGRAEGVVVEWRAGGAVRWAKWVDAHYRQPKGADVSGALNEVTSSRSSRQGRPQTATRSRRSRPTPRW